MTKWKGFVIILKHARKVSSVGRASALQAEGHRFEPCTFHQENIEARFRGLCYLARTEEVVNDSPVDCQSRRRPRRAVRAATEPHPSRQVKIKLPADLAHLVERHLAKVEVAGSSPVIRSKIKSRPSRSAFCFGGCRGEK